MSKFKKGDKVKIPPPDTRGVGGSDGMKATEMWAVQKAKEGGQDFLTVTEIGMYTGAVGVRGSAGTGDAQSWFAEKDLELYEEFPEKWAILSTKDIKNHEEMEEIILNSSYENPFRWNGNAGIGYYYIDKANKWEHINSLPMGYTEITTEQFKKQFMNETAKKIIGYKSPVILYDSVPQGTIFVKEKPNYKWYAPNNNAAGEKGQVMPQEIVETWEPVYEEQFKVGDWVTYVGGGNSVDTSAWIRGKVTGKINKIERDQFYVAPGSNHRSGFRKATPEEIKAVTEITIAGHKAEKSILGDVRFGCQSFTKTELQTVNRILSSTELKATLTIHGQIITPDIVKKVLNLI